MLIGQGCTIALGSCLMHRDLPPYRGTYGYRCHCPQEILAVFAGQLVI